MTNSRPFDLMEDVNEAEGIFNEDSMQEHIDAAIQEAEENKDDKDLMDAEEVLNFLRKKYFG